MTKKLVTREHRLSSYISAEELIKEIYYLRDTKNITLDDITFECDTYYEYSDTPYARAFLEYNELETDKEYDERVKKETAWAEQQAERERQQYEQLKKKFG
jgi:hypothetical protein